LEDRKSINWLRRRLLAWFDRHRRDLPWRRDRDPYRIWVSEVMLQQTTVAAVIPRYQVFLARFPDVFALAEAEERDVLQAWQGLGYYRRARHLHAAARTIVAQYNGQFPQEFDECCQLPGMGRYLVGAVLSQAFEKRLPILEANSERVLTRLLGETGNLRAAKVRNRLWQFADTMLPNRRVGDFNQALMELGALVCLPRKPRCSECPLADGCFAFRKGIQETLPVRSQKSPTVHRHELCLIIWRGSKALWLQRPAAGRWPLLWEFPRAPIPTHDSVPEAAPRMARELTGTDIALREHLGVIHYTIVREKVTVACWNAVWRRGRVRCPNHVKYRWLDCRSWDTLAFCSPQRRLARLAMEWVHKCHVNSDPTVGFP
jgi:A/G-specific adenine glycosylase